MSTSATCCSRKESSTRPRRNSNAPCASTRIFPMPTPISATCIWRRAGWARRRNAIGAPWRCGRTCRRRTTISASCSRRRASSRRRAGASSLRSRASRISSKPTTIWRARSWRPARSDNALGAVRHALADPRDARYQGAVRRVRASLRPRRRTVEDFRALLVRALDEPWGRGNDLARVAAKVVKQTSAVAACIARASASLAAAARGGGAVRSGGDRGDLRSTACCAACFNRPPIADLELERFLTSARFALLRIATRERGRARPPTPRLLNFCCALARQCFLNEHVFAATDEEIAAAQRLREQVSARAGAGAAIPELWLAVVASLFPARIAARQSIGAARQATWSDALTGVLVQQVTRAARRSRNCEPRIPRSRRSRTTCRASCASSTRKTRIRAGRRRNRRRSRCCSTSICAASSPPRISSRSARPTSTS